jgi:antitoxin VapB
MRKPGARETASAETPARAKLFANGRSQAVRIPRQFRLPGTEVLVHREGERLILEPIDPAGWAAGRWERLDELRRAAGVEWERPSDGVPPPIHRERKLP